MDKCKAKKTNPKTNKQKPQKNHPPKPNQKTQTPTQTKKPTSTDEKAVKTKFCFTDNFYSEL